MTNKISLLLSLFFLQTGMAKAQEKIWQGTNIRHGNKVSLTAYLAEDNPMGYGVIICPGGSYYWLDMKNEGDSVALWLQSQGISAFVLRYRAAGYLAYICKYRALFRGRQYPDMLTDAQRALQWVRTHAGAYQVQPDRVGILGFSAGGHLALSAACFHRHDFLKDTGMENETDLRPSFVGAVYPVATMTGPYAHKRSRRGLLGERRQHDAALCDSLSIERHIPPDCPPVFLVHCENDSVVNYRNSVALDSALTAAHVEHRYIQYQTGGHSFGASEKRGSPESREWKSAFVKWLMGIKL